MFRTIVAKDADSAASAGEGKYYPVEDLGRGLTGIKADETANTITLYFEKQAGPGRDTIVLASEEGKAAQAAEAIIGGINGKLSAAYVYKVVDGVDAEYGIVGIDAGSLTVTASDLAIDNDNNVDDIGFALTAGTPGASISATLTDSASTVLTITTTLDSSGEGTLLFNSSTLADGAGTLAVTQTVGEDSNVFNSTPTLYEVAAPTIADGNLVLASDITMSISGVTVGDTFSATITDGTNTTTAVTGTISTDPTTVTISSANQGSLTAGSDRTFSITLTRSDADSLTNDAVTTTTKLVTITE